MLFITTNDDCDIAWHVGDIRPEIYQPLDMNKPRRFVKEVYADGHELDYINSKFTELSKNNVRSWTWLNEDAEKIFSNL